MSNVRPIALAFSDLHLSLVQPACRSDKDWMAVQAGYLKQVWDLAQSLGDVPILFAGDLFDRWNPSPELIHFALEHLPDGMICVPGQHDLPNHRIEDMNRSGYGVLVKAGKIIDISGRKEVFGNLTAFGFGWGQQIKTISGKGMFIRVALIHRYIWSPKAKFPNAKKEDDVFNVAKELKGYDIAIFGDNHQDFGAVLEGTTILNCGGFIRRKSDDVWRHPGMYIIYSDGSYAKRNLSISADLFHEDIEERSEVPINMKAFIDGLESLGEHGLNFREVVEQHLKTEDMDEGVRQIIRQAIEH